jgi:hypothetical protein
MMAKHLAKTWGPLTAMIVIVVAGILISSPRVSVHANNDRERHHPRDPRIELGFDIAPVPLNLQGKDQALVGLGSYLVNAVTPCNDCHSAGTATQYATGGNPYFNQPKVVNPATYLGGGRDFGAVPATGTTHIISRNLTPDKTGRPAGGLTFAEFRQIMRTGIDLDHLHPNCSPTVTTNCLPPPFDGDLLQVMPWPTFQSMREHDLRAIYEYLSAVPCIAGPPAPSPLHNDCE